MLAKFIKHQHEAPAVQTFVMPSLNDAAPVNGLSNFAYPATNSASIFPSAHAQESFVANYPNAENHGLNEQKAIGIIENAEAEAAQILQRAEANAAIVQQAAEERGLAEAKIRVEAELDERVNEMRARLAETIETISNLEQNLAKRAENDLVALAFEIARKVVGRVVRDDREIALALARVTLERLHNRAVAQIYLHPDDFAFVSKHREQLNFQGALELVADDSITLGGCLVRTANGDLDARIEQQFDEIERGLI